MNRRHFLRHVAEIGGAGLLAPLLAVQTPSGQPYQKTAQVALVKTDDRAAGTQRALDLLGLRSYRGHAVFIKPNFNSADDAPGSTHNDMLAALVQKIQQAGAQRITVGDRSGMGDTRAVMQRKGIFDLARQLDFETLVFDDLNSRGWQVMTPPDSHWDQGFAIPKPVLDADAIVQTCCLKTHRFGGHFTLSLKNSVGLAAKYVPGDAYNFMTELHSSPHQRRMIAEINAAYTPDVVLMDGVEAFTTGGPDKGTLVHAGVILASSDRIALDAVGVAILRHFGTTPEVSAGAIFQQEQIARAVELGLGVSDPAQIELVTDDAPSAAFAETLRAILAAA
jgi:uncharacterized protein (DUF362 family)